MQLGKLKVNFEKTTKVSFKEISSLPPSLGQFKEYKISEDKFYIEMNNDEAMWISFDDSSIRSPIALIIGIGNYNILTRKKLELKLEPNNYIVTPPQPWIDGWKNDEETVCQFIAENKVKNNQEINYITLALFEAKSPDVLYYPDYPDLNCNYMLNGINLTSGGQIEQKIYPDLYGIHVWHEEPYIIKTIQIRGS